VLIFTAFADTANYLYDNLAPFAAQLGLHTGKVTGSDAPKTTLKKSYDFQSLLTLFSPRSKEKAIDPAERAGRAGHPHRHRLHLRRPEPSGLRLPDQLRHPLEPGAHHPAVRPDRPYRLPNASIQLVNYWPDITLDEYINLKERVENRMVIADVTATGDDNVAQPPSPTTSPTARSSCGACRTRSSSWRT
jgi:hypothetical protein